MLLHSLSLPHVSPVLSFLCLLAVAFINTMRCQQAGVELDSLEVVAEGRMRNDVAPLLPPVTWG